MVSYCGFIKSNCDDVYDESEGIFIYVLFASKFFPLPVPVPELFCKYPTRPVPKSKTPTRQTLLIIALKILFSHFFLTPCL